MEADDDEAFEQSKLSRSHKAALEALRISEKQNRLNQKSSEHNKESKKKAIKNSFVFESIYLSGTHRP